MYAPTRRQAEELASELKAHLPAAPYHAGLSAEVRGRVQAQFLDGKLDVIVATIAFGMGIDKPDVRTVIHTALPSSVEGYYQEIGRAGRDGAPSRAVLMHSYADRYTHDHFHERDYPDVKVLDGIFQLLSDEPRAKEDLQRRVRMDPEAFERALEKLWIHGGAIVDFAENVTQGRPGWREPYQAQMAQKLEQLQAMLRFADGSQCRMCALVAHFGDRTGSMQPCEICDFCAPGDCEAQRFREATDRELSFARDVLEALSKNDGRSTGKLYSEICGTTNFERDGFEQLLSAMARAGLIELKEETFTADGREIAFRRALLLQMVRTFELQIKERPEKKAKTKKRAAAKRAMKKAAGEDAIVEALKQWRMGIAKKEGVPAFRVLTDKALLGIAEERPSSNEELLSVAGVGPRAVSRYGAGILRVLSANGRN